MGLCNVCDSLEGASAEPKLNPNAAQARGNPAPERAFDAAAWRTERNAAKARAKVNGHEAFCLANADHFLAVRGRTPTNQTRARLDDLASAEGFAAGFLDGRTMIYAVTALGHSAHIKNA